MYWQKPDTRINNPGFTNILLTPSYRADPGSAPWPTTWKVKYLDSFLGASLKVRVPLNMPLHALPYPTVCLNPKPNQATKEVHGEQTMQTGVNSISLMSSK